MDTSGETAIDSTGDVEAVRAIPFSKMYDEEGYNANIPLPDKLKVVRSC